MHDTTRREYVLDRAHNEGRIARASRAHWAREWDRDPAGTEAVLAALQPMPGVLGDPGIAAGERQQAPHVAPVVAPQERTEITADLVKGWTEGLFPETRGAGARQGRITRDAA
jgi:hypothetical protein